MYTVSFSAPGGHGYTSVDPLEAVGLDLSPIQKEHWARLVAVVRGLTSEVRVRTRRGSAVMDLSSASIRIEMTVYLLELGIDPLPEGEESAGVVALAHRIAEAAEEITGMEAGDREFSKPFARVAPSDTMRVLGVMARDARRHDESGDAPERPAFGPAWQTEATQRRREERRRKNRVARKQARNQRRKR